MTSNGTATEGESPLILSITKADFRPLGNRRGHYNGVANRGLIDPEIYDKAFKDLDGDTKGKHLVIHIKEPAPKQSKPGNWKENEVAGTRLFGE